MLRSIGHGEPEVYPQGANGVLIIAAHNITLIIEPVKKKQYLLGLSLSFNTESVLISEYLEWEVTGSLEPGSAPLHSVRELHKEELEPGMRLRPI